MFFNILGRPLLLILFALSVFVTDAVAGNFGVSPLDLQFSSDRKRASITVSNEDKKPLSIRLTAMKWTQDVDGKDVYTETKDLIFFPKRLETKPGQKRVVRIGVKGNPAQGENAYRLFVEELPPPQTKKRQTTLAVLVTIGVPIFNSSNNFAQKVRVDKVNFVEGNMVLKMSNSGTSRSRISRFVTDDGKVVSESIKGRYLFPGISKSYTVKPPKDLCSIGKLSLVIETEKSRIRQNVSVPKNCGV